ncbi:MAG: FAD-binding oxidoreductase, partial [Tibeticola sp.]|nr:FAD-binding oxidoreductase [Tibeticola sp.]
MNAVLDRPPMFAATDRAARQREVVAALLAVLPAHAVLYTPEETTPYECDGLT